MNPILPPLLVIIAMVFVIAMAMNHYAKVAAREQAEQASRLRVKAEFAAIRQHRPDHIVGVSRWLGEAEGS